MKTSFIIFLLTCKLISAETLIVKGKDYPEAKVASVDKKTGIVQISHKWGVSGIKIEDLPKGFREKHKIELVDNIEEKRVQAAKERNNRIAKPKDNKPSGILDLKGYKVILTNDDGAIIRKNASPYVPKTKEELAVDEADYQKRLKEYNEYDGVEFRKEPTRKPKQKFTLNVTPTRMFFVTNSNLNFSDQLKKYQTFDKKCKVVGHVTIGDVKYTEVMVVNH